MNYEKPLEGTWPWALEQLFFGLAVRRRAWPEGQGITSAMSADPFDVGSADWELLRSTK